MEATARLAVTRTFLWHAYHERYYSGMETMIDDDTLRANLAASLRWHLEDRGWAQSELAKRAGAKDMEISRIVRGQYLPNSGTLARIAEALGTSIDLLLYRQPEITARAG